MLTNSDPKQRHFIELAYNGSSYHGWQIQPNALTVQEALNKAFSLLLKEEVNLVGCGRTDTGVHAAHFIAHVDTIQPITDPTSLLVRLNGLLGPTISVHRIVQVDSDHHARFSASAREYKYYLSSSKLPFFEGFYWYLHKDLDMDLMNSGAGYILGKKDFTSFAKLNSDSKTNICHVQLAEWVQLRDCFVFTIRADRFLRNMVRAIVGTLVNIGAGKTDPAEVEAIIKSRNRSEAGISVPAQGLFLSHVEYPESIFRTKKQEGVSGFTIL